MNFDERIFFYLLLKGLCTKKIGFKEPDLVKMFCQLMQIAFPEGTTVDLTQSDSKWMVREDSKGKQCEIGDLLVILKKENKVRFSFWQAKNCISKRYCNGHDSFPATASQHSAMTAGKIGRKYVPRFTFMTTGWRADFLYQNDDMSVCDYLVFYRGNTVPGFYDVDLVSAKYIKDLSPQLQKYVDGFQNRKITLWNQDFSGKISDSRSDKALFPDLLYAKSFYGIAKAIFTFSIGKVMDRHDYYLLKPYLPSKIKSKLPDDIVDDDMPEINGGKRPTIFIDSSKYDSDIICEDGVNQCLNNILEDLALKEGKKIF